MSTAADGGGAGSVAWKHVTSLYVDGNGRLLMTYSEDVSAFKACPISKSQDSRQHLVLRASKIDG